MTKSEYALRLAYDRGYRCDDSGRVISPTGNFLNPMKDRYDYCVISVCTKNHDHIGHTSFPIKVHRLQAFQKYGENLFEKGMEVRHLNNIKSDNSFNNIAIGTKSQNGLDNPPELNYRRAKFASDNALSINTKFTDDAIEEIGEFVHSGKNLLKDAIDKFSISSSNLSIIIKKYRSKHGIEKTPEMIKLARVASASSCRKWTDKEVEEIREMKKSGVKIKDIKKKFNISNGGIWRIMNYEYIT